MYRLGCPEVYFFFGKNNKLQDQSMQLFNLLLKIISMVRMRRFRQNVRGANGCRRAAGVGVHPTGMANV